MSKITGLPPVALTSNSAQQATPVHFFGSSCSSALWINSSPNERVFGFMQSVELQAEVVLIPKAIRLPL